MRTIIAIPNYNSGELLAKLVNQLCEVTQPNNIYVLDDVSNDDSVEQARNIQPDVHYILNDVNKGAGGNRNRINSRLPLDVEVIVFIDADMKVESLDLDEVARIFREPKVGLAGGLILSNIDQPMYWNYGPEMNPERDHWFFEHSRELTETNIQLLKDKDLDYNWLAPNIFPLSARKVDWIAEGLFAVRASVFKEIGGYDETMRYHEGQDLARRIRDLGYEVVFDPVFSATHLDLPVRGSSRHREVVEATRYYYKKHPHLKS